MKNYILNFRSQPVGGFVLCHGLNQREKDELAAFTNVVILIHGFNVTEEQGKERLGGFSQLLSASADASVSILWPGDSKFKGLSYSWEGKDADATAIEIVKFAQLIWPYGTTLHFVAHSLGSRVAMKTIDRFRGSKIRVGQVCLMAAAIDDYSLCQRAKYRRATSSSNRVAVLSSTKDTVLRYLYPIGRALESFIYQDQRGMALGYKGPAVAANEGIPPNVRSRKIDPEDRVGHGDYLPDRPGLGGKPAAAARFATSVLNGDEWPIQYIAD